MICVGVLWHKIGGSGSSCVLCSDVQQGYTQVRDVICALCGYHLGEKAIRLAINALHNENAPLKNSLVQFSVRGVSADFAVQGAYLCTSALCMSSLYRQPIQSVINLFVFCL